MSGFFMKTEWEGAQTTLYAVLATDLENGGYYADCAPAAINPQAEDDEICFKVWEMSYKMVGLDTPEKPTALNHCRKFGSMRLELTLIGKYPPMKPCPKSQKKGIYIGPQRKAKKVRRVNNQRQVQMRRLDTDHAESSEIPPLQMNTLVCGDVEAEASQKQVMVPKLFPVTNTFTQVLGKVE
ncbi:unnamed protein product [Dibothriocephalus latus]|uniref:Uncharacterized protein n=1 Tax=Dibothriocephalus latus TaxID=60516 RepID=A0A3P7LAP7_DIBLA|nr:unnamed protein product [Dibothriocephalus latus]